MKIFIGADHRGFALKEKIKMWLSGQGYEVIDCGNTVLDPADDYPDFSLAVADRLIKERGKAMSAPGATLAAAGIVVCGSGVGVTVTANKVPGVRCASGLTALEVGRGRVEDDLNILALSADYVDESDAQAKITAFLTIPFKGDERHVRRLKKIEARENG